MAIDPRRRFPFGQMAPMLYGAGTLNNAAPSFQGPAYYNQMFNRPLQDWSQFMPTNSPLAGGGGSLYQTPWWGYGSGGGSGWGGGYGGMPGGGLMGGGMMGGYPGWGGGYPGYTQPGFGGYRPPQFGGGTTPGFSPGPIGSTQPTTPGRHHPEMYDADGNYVGAEGGGAREANWTGGGHGGGGAGGVPWQDTFMAPLGHRLGWNFAGYNPGQGQDTGSSYVDMEDTDEGFMLDALSGPPVRGLLDDPVGTAQFHGDQFDQTTGLLGSDAGLAAAQAAQEAQMSMDIFGPDLDPTIQANEFTGVNTSPYSGGDPMANVNAVPAVSNWSQPSMTPTTTTPAYSTQPVGAIPSLDQAAKTAQMKASTAKAAQVAKAAEAFRQSQAAEAFRRDEERLANLRGRDNFDAREMAELEARVGAYRGDPVGRAIAIQERDERGRDDTSGERSAGMGGGKGGFAGPDRW